MRKLINHLFTKLPSKLEVLNRSQQVVKLSFTKCNSFFPYQFSTSSSTLSKPFEVEHFLALEKVDSEMKEIRFLPVDILK